MVSAHYPLQYGAAMNDSPPLTLVSVETENFVSPALYGFSGLDAKFRNLGMNGRHIAHHLLDQSKGVDSCNVLQQKSIEWNVVVKGYKGATQPKHGKRESDC
ncbi:MAG: hypothetical protein P8M53_09625 [Pirellulales bacterium]|nr:hypothetical protein [Pirellulales bacterium]